jgi:hypothetical protein
VATGTSKGGQEMTLEQLREAMKAAEIKYQENPELIHTAQDDLLLEFINDPEVTEIYNRTAKWYE